MTRPASPGWRAASTRPGPPAVAGDAALRGASLKLVGEALLQAKVGASLVPTLTQSFALTAALIFTVFLLVFRSASARLMAMIPSLFAILCTFLALRLARRRAQRGHHPHRHHRARHHRERPDPLLPPPARGRGAGRARRRPCATPCGSRGGPSSSPRSSTPPASWAWPSPASRRSASSGWRPPAPSCWPWWPTSRRCRPRSGSCGGRGRGAEARGCAGWPGRRRCPPTPRPP